VSRCGGEPLRPYMGSAGVELMGSAFTIQGTVFRNSTGGLYLNATSGGRISGCTFSGMEYGITGTMVGAASIEGCLFEELDWALMIIRNPLVSTEVLDLVGCRFSSVGTYAVWISGPRLVRVQENRFEDCNTALFLKGTSEATADVTVSSNAFSGGFCCIELVGVIGVAVWNNDLTEFNIAIQARSGTFAMAKVNVSGNTFHDGGTGIQLGYGRDLTIAGNSFRDVRVGVRPQTGGVLIVGNDFEGASNAGVLYQGEGLVEVVGNRFANCSYGLKVQHDSILLPGLLLVNNTFAGNHVGALLRDVEPLVLEGNRWEGDGTGLLVIGSELDIDGDVSVDGCGVGIRLSAVRGLIRGVSVTNCSIGLVADLGTTVTLEGCDLSSCDMDATAANISTVVLLDCQHGGAFDLHDQWSEVRLVWTCTLELVYASDGTPAPYIPCELVPAIAPSLGKYQSDVDGMVGPRRIIQARYLRDGVQWYIPYTVNVEFNGIVHPFSVPFQGEHSYVLVLDDVPPVVNVVEPVEGARLNASAVRFSIVLDYVHSSVSTLAVEVDGEVLRTLYDPGPDVEFEEPIEDGTHTVVVSSLDAWGNECQVTLAFEMDTEPPEVELTSPEDGTLTNLTEVLVEGVVRGAVDAELAGRPLELGGDGTFSVTLELVDEGENDITLAAWDSFGNLAAINVRVVRDTQAPRVVLGSLPALTRESRLTITGWTDAQVLLVAGEEVPLGAEGCFTVEV
ncbi:MAG: right-handed parallel beta-helix repeat-containing protein, partial [Thermoplasmata archaeon]|nr:right-handed parallel beta-helix repeat-containing protein [Thermoplasmata archaeon]